MKSRQFVIFYFINETIYFLFCRWYAGRITRAEAENYLRNKGYRNGTFLVRVSGKETSSMIYLFIINASCSSLMNTDEYALSVICLNVVTHYKILQNIMTTRYFITSKKSFSNIRELVSTYKGEELFKCLQYRIGMVRFVKFTQIRSSHHIKHHRRDIYDNMIFIESCARLNTHKCFLIYVCV